MTPDLRLVYGCPKWCAEDHTVQQGEDRECHAGDDWQLRLPDGTVMMEARLVHEAGQKFPQLAVNGPDLGTLLDDVQLLGADEAYALEAELQRFLHRIQRAARTLQGNRPPRPRKLSKPGQHVRSGWHETRLYLAERDGRQCFYCRTPFDKLRGVTIDHYVPKSRWACNLPANLVLACEPCNLAKGDRLTWSMAAVLLAWRQEQAATVPDRHTVTVTASRTGTPGREAPEVGETPSWGPAVAACS